MHLAYLVKFVCCVRTPRPGRRQARSLGKSGVGAVDKNLQSVICLIKIKKVTTLGVKKITLRLFYANSFANNAGGKIKLL